VSFDSIVSADFPQTRKREGEGGVEKGDGERRNRAQTRPPGSGDNQERTENRVQGSDAGHRQALRSQAQVGQDHTEPCSVAPQTLKQSQEAGITR